MIIFNCFQTGFQTSELCVYIHRVGNRICGAIENPDRDLIGLIGDAALFGFLTPPSQAKDKDFVISGL